VSYTVYILCFVHAVINKVKTVYAFGYVDFVVQKILSGEDNMKFDF